MTELRLWTPLQQNKNQHDHIAVVCLQQPIRLQNLPFCSWVTEHIEADLWLLGLKMSSTHNLCQIWKIPLKRSWYIELKVNSNHAMAQFIVLYL